jgi:arginyl-tRNA synthetase
MKQVVIGILKKALKKLGVNLTEQEIERLIEVPPRLDMGDYAFPCFFMAEELKMSPHEIALELREKIGNISSIDLDDVTVVGGYVNFFIDRKSLARQVIWDSIQKKKNFGKTKLGNRKKIVVEFSSPNIAKPFGIGHLRSTIIGNSLAKISEFVGYKPIKINYIGDWGTQFGKLIYGFEKYGSETRLMNNPIKHLLNLYVRVSKSKKNDEPSREAFKRLEQRDKKALMLWKVFRNLSLKEFEKIYKTFNIEFNEYKGESDTVKYTKRVIEELKQKNLLKKSKGAMIVDLKEFGLGVCLIQKTDGTTLYATRDIAAAIQRYEKYKFEKMIYQVGKEQKLYFQQIFKVLELMGYKWAQNCIHSEHGLYLDKDGKKFATRKGKTIFMEDILKKTKTLTAREIKKRFPKIKKDDLEERALKVAIAAIFYGDLKNTKKNDIVFNLKKFTSFDGNTGPYILYAYARAGSILKKAEKKEITSKFNIPDLEEQEFELIKKLSQFPDIVIDSFTHLNPSIIANYCYQVCQKFNEFYQSCPVIKSESATFRLALVESSRQILRNALHLLGIEVLEEM